jgi:hypothetical protein
MDRLVWPGSCQSDRLASTQPLEAESNRAPAITPIRRGIQDNFAQHSGVRGVNGQHEGQQAKETDRKRDARE